MIGFGEKSSTSLVLGSSCPDQVNISCPADVGHHNNHYFTSLVGRILYGIYNIIMIIVLLNILIALFSNTLTLTKVRKIAY